MKALCAFAIAVVSLALPPMAGAQDKPGAVLVAGNVRASDSALIKRTAGVVLAGAGWQIKDPTVSAKAATAAVQCTTLPCVNSAVGDKTLARVVTIHAEFDSKSFLVKLTGTLLDAQASGAPPTAQRFCERCSDDTLTIAVQELTRELVNQAAVYDGRTVLDITSDPPGAAVLVDGNLAGTTNGKIALTPGTHLIRIELSGYEASTHTVVGIEGKTAIISASLKKSGAPTTTSTTLPTGTQSNPAANSSTAPALVGNPPIGPAAEPSRKTSLLVPGLLIGGGALILGQGIATVIAGSDDEGTHVYESATTIGAVECVVGTAAISAGVYLLLRRAKHAPRSTVAIGKSSFAVGYQVSF